MGQAGITDPARVIRGAPDNAVSNAAVILTTQVLVTDLSEKEKAPAMAMPDGEY